MGSRSTTRKGNQEASSHASTVAANTHSRSVHELRLPKSSADTATKEFHEAARSCRDEVARMHRLLESLPKAEQREVQHLLTSMSRIMVAPLEKPKQQGRTMAPHMQLSFYDEPPMACRERSETTASSCADEPTVSRSCSTESESDCGYLSESSLDAMLEAVFDDDHIPERRCVD